VFEGNSTSPGGMIASTWEPGEGSSLRLLIQDDADLKRVTITPAPGSSTATMF
jgi:hypothetical protein